MRLFIKYLFLLIGHVIVCNSKAQDLNFTFKHFGTEEGMPSNTVYCATEDKNGYMWFGTDAGVCRFDGNEFVTFDSKIGLPSNDVFDILCDSKNRLWFVTFSNKVSYFYNGKIYNEFNDSSLAKFKIKQKISHILEDNNKNIWVVENGKEINILKNNKIQNFKILNAEEEKIYGIMRLIKLDNGILINTNLVNHFVDNNYKISSASPIQNRKSIFIDDFFIKDSAVYLFNKNNYFKENLTEFILNKSDAFKVGKFSKYIFKLNSNDYLNTTNDEGKLLVLNKNIELKNTFLRGKGVSYVYSSKNGTKYFTTLKDGIYLNNNFNSLEIEMDKNPIYATSIYKFNEGILIGNNNHQLLYFKNYISKAKKELVSNVENLKSGYRVNKVIELNKNEFFIATDVSVFKYNINCNKLTCITEKDNSLYFGAVKNIYYLNGKLYISTNRGLLVCDSNFNQKQLIINYANMWSICNYNNKIILSSLNKLFTFNGDSTAPFHINSPTNSRIVEVINFNNNLYILTAEDGLYSLKNDTIKKIDLAISSPNCNRAIIYQSKIYLATKKGINIIDEKNKSVSYIYECDGLASNNVNDLAIQNDTLYAATDKGVSIIDLAHLPNNQFTNYYINPIIKGTDTSWNKPNITTYDDIPLRFELNSINYSTDGNFKHYYRIKELEDKWSITENKFIEIKNLKPGCYTLETYAENSYGLKSKTITYTFEVLPYFFQRRLVQAAIVLLMLLLSYWIYKHQLKKLLLRENNIKEMETRMMNLELSSWRAKINPHFIFNALNAMQSIFLSKNFEKANEYLANLSKVLRRTILHSGDIMVSIDNEIAYLESYLSLEKVKRNENLKYHFTVSPEALKEFYMPSMIIQPVIENSLKHGIKENKNGEITILFFEEENKIVCHILDNGIGFGQGDLKNTTSKGILLINEKLNLIEKLLNDKIIYKQQNRLDESNNIIGAMTIFIFSMYKKNININESIINR